MTDVPENVSPMRPIEDGSYDFGQVIAVEVSPTPRDQTVRLHALASRHRAGTFGGTAKATTVAIHMDQQVATCVVSQLHGLFRSMGWPLPE